MKDVCTREDIEHIVNSFYKKVREDAVLGYIFNDIAKVNWEQHLPAMYAFWDFIALGNGNYATNMMTPHFALHEKIKLEPVHFERWIQLFNETLDAEYAGATTEAMKQRAHSIAETLKFKLNNTDKLRII